MTTILNFLKPYKLLCFFTLLVMFVDVAGSLLIPTIMAKMIDAGIEGKDVSYMIQSGKIMLIVAIISGLSALLGSYLAATLSSKLGRDMRKAIYGKSLEFSSYDFERFGTGSMITRTMNDVNIVQQSAVWLIQMVLPVPAVCVSGVVMAFIIDASMGFLLIGAIVAIMSLSVFITRKASLIFDMLQKFLDKMNVLLRENISGVRVIRAFNKEKYEEKRMRKSFEDYAESAIRANRLFAALESFALFAVNFLFVIILWLGGNRIGIGLMEIGDIVALAQYVAIISFYIMMAQMVMIMMPRAIICVRRILEPLSRTPEIKDGNMSLDTSMEPTEEVVSFQKVSFRFADADENVLENLNFKCKKGETTAIIGGTGSGKSTSLYSILNRLNKEGVNIMTVEDPVEYQIQGINQVQQNVKAGLTFAAALRSFLRQDPDIIMVGEIRDGETAQIAVEAALTGHLVLSTLHTNDAPGAITRLTEMGIEPFLCSSSVICVLAQRLARCICPSCKEAYIPPMESVRKFGLAAYTDSEITFYKGRGCDNCKMSGYKGRTGIHELLTVSDRIRSLILQRCSTAEIRQCAIEEGMKTMPDDGLRKVLDGITTIEECLRVVFIEGQEI